MLDVVNGPTCPSLGGSTSMTGHVLALCRPTLWTLVPNLPRRLIALYDTYPSCGSIILFRIFDTLFPRLTLALISFSVAIAVANLMRLLFRVTRENVFLFKGNDF